MPQLPNECKFTWILYVTSVEEYLKMHTYENFKAVVENPTSLPSPFASLQAFTYSISYNLMTSNIILECDVFVSLAQSEYMALVFDRKRSDTFVSHVPYGSRHKNSVLVTRRWFFHLLEVTTCIRHFGLREVDGTKTCAYPVHAR